MRFELGTSGSKRKEANHWANAASFFSNAISHVEIKNLSKNVFNLNAL